MANEPWTFVQNLPIIFLKPKPYEEVVKTKINALEFALRFLYSSDFVVDVFET